MPTTPKQHVPGIASSRTAQLEANEAVQSLRRIYTRAGITRADIVLSKTREHNTEIYTLDPEKIATWTAAEKVAACRDNVWGATVEGSTVRVFID